MKAQQQLSQFTDQFFGQLFDARKYINAENGQYDDILLTYIKDIVNPVEDTQDSLNIPQDLLDIIKAVNIESTASLTKILQFNLISKLLDKLKKDPRFDMPNY